MRPKIDLQELDYAFDDAGSEANWYLDRQTGAVLVVTGDTQRDLERLYEDLDRAEPLSAEELDAALAERSSRDWERDALQEANLIEADDGTRFLPVPDRGSREGYRDMEDFIDTLPPGRLQDRLARHPGTRSLPPLQRRPAQRPGRGTTLVRLPRRPPPLARPRLARLRRHRTRIGPGAGGRRAAGVRMPSGRRCAARGVGC